MTDRIFVGGGGDGYGLPQELLLRYGNRHGLVAGATGTGKTITMQVLAEGFSAAGVPVFLSDIKGDLGGMAVAGSPEGKLHGAFLKRAERIGLADLGYAACPVTFWDMFGETGHPIRTTVSDMGPVLLSRLLDLTEAQEGVINVAFRLADDEGLPILDLKDLQAMLTWMGQNARDLTLRYGSVATASVGAIQRRLLVLENQGAAKFLGEPALDIRDLMAIDPATGRGRVNILSAWKLMETPQLYATFLLWLLSELFEQLPEVGDPDKPRLVFFFDEAHLLFNRAPPALVDKVERVARLIRSKGVGVYFVTQNPDDVPEAILAQLGNRVQHALRAFTARDQQALRRAAQTYRPNPRFSTEEAIRDVGTGEAVTSFLEERGAPGIVERTLVRPPRSLIGPIPEGERARIVAGSPFFGKYDTPIDRDSAHERLARREAEAARATAEAEAARPEPEAREFNRARRLDVPERRRAPEPEREPARRPRSPARSDSVVDAFAKSFARSIGTRAGSSLARGILGSLLRGR